MADEVNESELDESMSTLSKMLKAEGSDVDLIKAKKSDDEDDSDDDDYDAKYMKRNMPRYMKENQSGNKDMKKMKKAVDHEADSVSDELEDAEAVLINGTDMFKASQEHAEKTTQVIESLSNSQEQNTSLLKALSSVVLEMGEQIQKMGSEAQPRKSVLNAGETKLIKADTGDQSENAPLQKAAEYMQKNTLLGIKKLVLKAMSTGDQKAGIVVTELESCFGDLNLLPNSSQKYVADLISAQEAGA